jgi:UDP-N-acetylmuramoyl-tripeptide--D-alanyl-D-alanine ligase
MIYEGLADSGTAVVNMDDPVISGRAPELMRRRLTFGTGAGCDVRLLDVRTDGLDGQMLLLDICGRRTETSIRHLGRHNAVNAAAAAAVGAALGIPAESIAGGLAAVEPVSKRLEHTVVGGVHMLNDAYNANPRSMEGALDTLVALAGGSQVCAVLGDMLELGPGSHDLHMELGRSVAARGISSLIVLGAESENIVRGAVEAGMPESACYKAMDSADAAWILRKRARPGGWVLIKGSRGMRMEVVLEHFRQSFSGGQG